MTKESRALYQYLDAEIEKLEDKLAKFRGTRSYDSGVRMHCSESKLEGLYKAKRLIRKAEKQSQIEAKENTL